ncbi:MAG: sulfite exporter TauE/SafE family protein, partial [Phycisphaerae bacterium]|nr:sulfite exporter TauE/SafE family protein [Phycisphaerae bacterium]
IAIAWPDPKGSVGLLLPLLIFADLFSAGYYRRKALWAHIIPPLPWAIAGIITGYFTLEHIKGQHLKPLIGVIVLIMLGVKYWQSTRKKTDSQNGNLFHLHWTFAVVIGFLAGLTSMMANAAGPIMIIYLMAKHIPKTEFVGTAAWFFFIVNWIKVPFMLDLDMITRQSFKLNAVMFPVIAIGAVTGILMLKHIPQKVFNKAVLILAAAAAIKLLLS